LVFKNNSQENIRIALFYSENLKDFQFSQTPEGEQVPYGAGKQNPALLWQSRANFSGRSEVSSLPPQHLEFVSNLRVLKRKGFQTFSLILPNLIHQSKKKDLKN